MAAPRSLEVKNSKCSKFCKPFPLRWRSFAKIRGSRSIGCESEPTVLESALVSKGNRIFLPNGFVRIVSESISRVCILFPANSYETVFHSCPDRWKTGSRADVLQRNCANHLWCWKACNKWRWLHNIVLTHSRWRVDGKWKTSTRDKPWSGAYKESLHHWQFYKSFQRNIFCIHSKPSWEAKEETFCNLFCENHWHCHCCLIKK